MIYHLVGLVLTEPLVGLVLTVPLVGLVLTLPLMLMLNKKDHHVI